MVKNKSSIVLGAVAGTLMSGLAHAHIRMDAPIARNVWAAQPSADPIKVGPCGSGEGDVRTQDSDKINVFSPGETITVSWYETINHPAHYRIAIDMDGQDDFPEKSGPDDIVDPPVLPILLDGIPDAAGGPGTYSVEVTLPNETCDNCTLQLIQYMTDRNEPYYVCADLVIEGEPDGGTGGGTTMEPGSGGASGVDATGGGTGVGSSSATTGDTGSGGQLGNETTTSSNEMSGGTANDTNPSGGGNALDGSTTGSTTEADPYAPSMTSEGDPQANCAFSPGTGGRSIGLLTLVTLFVGMLLRGRRRLFS